MEQPTHKKWQAEVGYYFQPPRYPHSPGHPALDVIIRSEPTHQHYDPETLELNVREDDPSKGAISRKLDVFHPWQVVNHYDVVAGRVIINDRRGKKVESFCFGGDLTIDSENNMTRCTIQSDAPILQMIDLDSLPALLATEVEVLLAEIRGRSPEDLEGYEARLVNVEPFNLYRSCLIELRDRLADIDHQEFDPYVMLREFIVGEFEALQQQRKWTSAPPNLSSLLLPTSSEKQG